MSLAGYAAFWLAALIIFLAFFHLMYGRHACRLMRVLLAKDTPNDQRNALLARLGHLLETFWEAVKR